VIKPSDVCLASLPSIPLGGIGELPDLPAVYFAIDAAGCVQYIGISKNLGRRWRKHHRYDQLSQKDGVRIAYLCVSEASMLRAIESELIEYFAPPLNGVSVEKRDRKKVKVGKMPTNLSTRTYTGISEIMKLTFGQWFKMRRTLIGVGQGAIADVLGVKAQTIYNWEHDRTQPQLTPSQTAALCRVLNVGFETLEKAYAGEMQASD